MIKKKVGLVLLFLLALPLLVSAAPPVVDFNFTPTSPFAFQGITFDPNITPNGDLNLLFWGFSTDGNINYMLGGFGATIFSDDFEDASITDWDVNSGVWSTINTGTTTVIDGSGAPPTAISHTVSDMNNISADININFQVNVTSAGLNAEFFWFTDQNGPDDLNGYELLIQSATTQLRKRTNGVPTALLISPGLTVGTFHDINITQSSGGSINLKIDGSNIGTVIDTDYNRGNRIILSTENATTSAQWDNIIIRKSGLVAINPDKNENFTFNTVGLKTICLTAGNNDGNTTFCKNLTIAGNVGFYVFDENTGLPIKTAKAKVGGVITSPDSNGLISIPFPTVASDFVIEVYDVNYPSRFFTYYLDQNTFLQKNLFLLDENKGRNIQFLIRDINTTKYPNNFLRIEKNGKVVSRVYTNNRAITIPLYLANLTTDYNFFIDQNSNSSNLFNYDNTIVNVALPKNEQTMENISPWEINVTDLTSIDQNGLTGSFNFSIYPNTWHPYKITIDSNNLNYFERFYHIRSLGGQDNIGLQPYMLRPEDNALSASMVLENSLISQKIPYYVFKFYTDVGQQASVLVESPQTDSAGKFIFSSVTGKNYFFQIFDEDGDLVNTGSFINNSATEYVTDIFFGTINALFPTNGIIDVNIIQPSDNFLYLNDRNNFGILYSVNSTGPTFSLVSTLITINNIVVFSENNIPVSPATTFNTGQLFDANFSTNEDYVTAEVKITIVSSTGTITKYYKYPLRQILNPFNLNPSLSSLRTSLGDFGAALLYLLIAIFISIGLRFNPSFGVDNNAMVFVLMIWTGLAAFIGLIDILIAFMGIMGGIGYWVLQRRPLG